MLFIVTLFNYRTPLPVDRDIKVYTTGGM